MRKKIFMFLLTTCLITGCNYQMVDLNYNFNKAIIDTGEDVLTIEVASWRDYEDGDQIQVTATDGTVYLTSANKCVLIQEVKK